MHWIVLMFCLGVMMGGMFLLLGAFNGSDSRYKAMLVSDLLQQPSVWARNGANGGIVGAHAESVGI